MGSGYESLYSNTSFGVGGTVVDCITLIKLEPTGPGSDRELVVSVLPTSMGLPVISVSSSVL